MSGNKEITSDKTAAQDAEPKKLDRPPLKDRAVIFLRSSRWAKIFAWVVVLLAWVATLGVAWLCWYLGFAEIWNWTKGDIFKSIAALFGSMFLFAIPFWAAMLAYQVTIFAAELSFDEDDKPIQDAREQLVQSEANAIAQLESADQAGLLPLLRYSRAQLDAYYVMSLAQTRRSFVNAAIAMWLGFAILVTGIALYIGPVEQLGIARPSLEASSLVIIGAVIVEIISALFLWVYQSTISQLTFYYRRQMQSHTAILCYRIAAGMKNGEAAKLEIIRHLLQNAELPERRALPSGKRMAGLLNPAPEPAGD
jgi:hypothetical protein